MKKIDKPTMEDLVKPKADYKTKIAFLAALEDARRQQEALLKRASKA